MDAATGNERRPTVARQYSGTCCRCDEDERSRWRPATKWQNDFTGTAGNLGKERLKRSH